MSRLELDFSLPPPLRRRFHGVQNLAFHAIAVWNSSDAGRSHRVRAGGHVWPSVRAWGGKRDPYRVPALPHGGGADSDGPGSSEGVRVWSDLVVSGVLCTVKPKVPFV